MSVAGISQILAQAAGTTGAGAAARGGQSFAQILQGAFAEVTGAQAQANQVLAQYAMGGGATIEQVMLATSRAELLVEAAGAVTTRAISAYQSLMQTNIG